MEQSDHEIFRLKPRDFKKCGNIWDLRKHPERTRRWRRETHGEQYSPPRRTP